MKRIIYSLTMIFVGMVFYGCFESDKAEILTSTSYNNDKTVIEKIMTGEEFDKIVLGNNTTTSAITTNLNLMTEYNGAEIIWNLDLTEGRVTTTGAVSIPTDADKELIISAEIKKGKMTAKKELKLTLKKNDSFILVEGGEINNSGTTIKVGSFFIGKYEVTQKEWMDIMGYNNSANQSGYNYPVEKVSWYEAIKFCNAKSDKEGLERVYTIENETTLPYTITTDTNKNGYRLPTKNEWLYAAKGGAKTQGYTYSGTNIVGDAGWYYTNSGMKTHEVGQKTPNELGIYDMTGNVWEWTNETCSVSSKWVAGNSYEGYEYRMDVTYFDTFSLYQKNTAGENKVYGYATVGIRIVRNK